MPLTANGQTTTSSLDAFAGKTIESIESSAYYTEREIYAIKINFTDGTFFLLTLSGVRFDQFSSTPIIQVSTP